MKTSVYCALLLGLLASGIVCLRAQGAVSPSMPGYQPLSDVQLDQLLGPIALYPDPLIAEILPASTLPEQIVMADRYVSGGGDFNQIDQQSWDASIKALTRYPKVLKWLDDNLNWTTELGQAFCNQQPEVMESIQRLRMSAANFGNLQSTPQQQVITDGGYIEIVPVDPQLLFVPVYQPDLVYDQSANGAVFITFGSGWPVGAWLNCDFDWSHHNLIIWEHDHPRPANWWHEAARQRDQGQARIWHSNYHPEATMGNRGDRGWNQNPVRHPETSVVIRPEPIHPVPPNQHSVTIHQAAPPQVEHHAPPISRPESNGAFIGIQSSHDTKTFSNRGQQSLQTTPHSAPVSRSVPAVSSGDGNHSNSQKKH